MHRRRACGERPFSPKALAPLLSRVPLPTADQVPLNILFDPFLHGFLVFCKIDFQFVMGALIEPCLNMHPITFSRPVPFAHGNPPFMKS